jgi:uncharacterized ubiquitin-like protein YukD
MHWSGEVFAVTGVLPSDTIENVKTEVEKRKKVPKEQQRFSFGGSPIDPQKSLKDQEIKHKSILVLEDPAGAKIEAPKREKFRLSVFSAPSASFNANLDKYKVKDKETESGSIMKIKHWKGDIFDLPFDPTEYCDDVKEKIQKVRGIPVGQLRLTFQGKPVQDSTLEEQNIVHGSTLVLEPMQIRVDTPDGTGLTLAVELDDTIRQLKRLVFKEKKGFPVGAQCIMTGAEELPDDKTLLDCNVDHEDVLTLEVFELSAMHWSGAVFSITEILPTDKMDVLKRRVEKVNQIPKDKQEYIFDGVSIDALKTFKEQGLKHKSILIMQDPHETSTGGSKKEKLVLSLFSTQTTAMPSANDTSHIDTSHHSEELDEPGPTPTMPKENGTQILPREASKPVLSKPRAKVGKNVTLLSVRIKYWTGEDFDLKMKSNEYCRDVKEQIFKLRKIPVEQQHLTFQGRPLQEDLTLMEQEIANRSTLVLEPMRIILKTPGSRELRLVVDLDFTIKRIKRLVFKERPELPVNVQCLTCGGDELGDGSTLAECNVQHEDVLTLEVYRISAIDWSGIEFVIEGVRPSDTLDDMKMRVARIKQIPKAQQRFSLDGKPLDEVLTLKSQGVKHGTVLTMEPPIAQSPKRLSVKPRNDKNVITIQINHWNGDTFVLDMDAADFCSTLQDRIYDIKKIPVDQQRLSFQGRPLKTDSTLKDQKVVNQSIVVLEPMRVRVKTPTQEEVTIVVELDWIIKKIKRLVFKETRSFPVNVQCIMFRGKELSDEMTLADCKVGHEDILLLEVYVISVKLESGEIVALSGIRPNDTMDDVKKKIAKSKQTPKSRQQERLTCNGKILQDGPTTLRSLGIKHKSILVLDGPDNMAVKKATKLSQK